MNRGRVAAVVLAVFVASAATAGGGESATSANQSYGPAFAHLKTLVGAWRITAASVRSEPYADDRTVVYTLTGNGSVLVERFEGEPSMASFYHLDGDDLRLTHYCNAGNQPRMRAVSWDAERARLRFGFVDVTDLAEPTAYHTRELEIVFRDEDHVQLHFEGRKRGEAVPAVMTLERRR